MKFRGVVYKSKFIDTNDVINVDKPPKKVRRYFLNNLDYAYETKNEIETSINNLIDKVMLTCSVSEKEAVNLLNNN